jgi:hypothetical protein
MYQSIAPYLSAVVDIDHIVLNIQTEMTTNLDLWLDAQSRRLLYLRDYRT